MSHNKSVIGHRKKPIQEAIKKLFSFWINANCSDEIVHKEWIQDNGYPAKSVSHIYSWYHNGGMAKDKIPFWAMRETFIDILENKKKFWDRVKTMWKYFSPLLSRYWEWSSYNGHGAYRYELDLLTFKLKTFYRESKGDQYGIVGCTRRYHTLQNYFSGKFIGEYTDECSDWENDKPMTDEEFENYRSGVIEGRFND